MNNLPVFKRTSLYRIASGFATVALFCGFATQFSAAQLRKTKDATPRAIAVVQWPANNEGKATPQLVPIIIRIDGRFYDASLYRATPRPMALEPGTVYEVQSKGAPIGYFTVERPFSGKMWTARGDWKASELRRDFQDFSDRPQTAVVVKNRTATDPPVTESVDDRDTTKKSTTVYDEQGREIPPDQVKDDERNKDGSRPPLVIGPRPAPSEPAPKTASTDDERPRLTRNPGDQQTSTETPIPPTSQPPGTAQAPDDPDRPRITRNPTGAAQRQTPAPEPKRAEDDPNRPRLKRGAPASPRTEVPEDAKAGEPVPERIRLFASLSPLPAPDSFVDRVYEAVAVSDEADLKTDPMEFVYRMREDEQNELREKMVTLALTELNKTNPTRVSTKTAAKKTASKAATRANQNHTVENLRFHAFDPLGNNVPVMVLSGQRENAFVTVVARLEPDGTPRKIFASATRADRLDVTPRYELVDAVDADADRRADLLFHVLRQDANGYAVFKIGADNLQELFRTVR